MDPQKPDELDAPLLGSRPLPYLLVFAVLFAISLAPFFLCSPLPLSDYPNHMARMYILAKLDHSATLSQFYAADWTFVPNLAMDLLLPPLISVIPAEPATLAFTALALFLIASGTIFLHRELHRRWSLLPFTVFLVLYNRQFLWGFLNYLFSVGLALWLLVLYLRVRTWAVFPRLALLSIVSTLLLVAHLHAFASYGVIVAGYEVSIAWRERRAGRAISWKQLGVAFGQFAVPVLVFLLLSATRRQSGRVSLGTPVDKLAGLLDIFNNYVLPLDIGTFLALAAVVAFGVFRAKLRLHPLVRLPLAALFVLYLLLPQTLFGSSGADRRLLVVVVLLAIAGFGGFVASRRTRWILAIGVAGLFCVRMGVIGENWIKADRVYADVIAAVDQIRPGSRLAIAVGGDTYPYLQNPPLDHVANVAVIRKDAFVNSLFAEPGKSPLRILYAADTHFYRSESQNYRRGTNGQPEQGLMNPEKDIPLDRFDDVLYVNRRYFEAPDARLKPMLERGIAALFAVDRSAADPAR